jgi:hypothetical protein
MECPSSNLVLFEERSVLKRLGRVTTSRDESVEEDKQVEYIR